MGLILSGASAWPGARLGVEKMKGRF